MHVNYDIVDMLVAMSFTDRMFHFLLDGHAHLQGGDSRALSRLPNCDAGGLDSARLSPPASGRGRLLTPTLHWPQYPH